MPFLVDKMRIKNKKYDKRVKLTDEDKKNIVLDYNTGLCSYNDLAKKYKVSKRSIQFVIHPEKKEIAKMQYKERRKDGRYYDKDKHREHMKTHRNHKKELFKKNLLQ